MATQLQDTVIVLYVILGFTVLLEINTIKFQDVGQCLVDIILKKLNAKHTVIPHGNIS